MTDIVKRLRHQRSTKGGSLYGEAADEIERLRAEVRRARLDGATMFQRAAKGMTAIGIASLDPAKVIDREAGE